MIHNKYVFIPNYGRIILILHPIIDHQSVASIFVGGSGLLLFENCLERLKRFKDGLVKLR